MAKIAGFVQKIFGKNATNIGQVGSAAAGTKLLTSNTATIQALAAFENGISDVTLTSKRIIPQEEFMALHYLHTLQNAYTQQEGIHEYNSGVTYFTNSIVKKSGTYEIYGSLVDDNIGNALTNVTKWVKLQDLSTNGIIFGTNSIKFSNGTLVQWGSSLNTGTTTTVTLPTAYSTNNFRIYISAEEALALATNGIFAYPENGTKTTGSFKWGSSSQSSGTVTANSTASSVVANWLTIGAV